MSHIDTCLIQGDGSSPQLRIALSDMAAPDKKALDSIVLLSLGANHDHLMAAVKSCSSIRCPVYLSETYGILGFDESEGRNIELMEKGRGQEYGCRGGDGGQGVVVVAYRGGAFLATHEAIPDTASSVLVISDNTNMDETLEVDASMLLPITQVE